VLKGLFWEWWWPVGPKLLLDQMAALVPEIMNLQIAQYSNEHKVSDTESISNLRWGVGDTTLLSSLT
jgi:hypothetical protein